MMKLFLKFYFQKFVNVFLVVCCMFLFFLFGFKRRCFMDFSILFVVFESEEDQYNEVDRKVFVLIDLLGLIFLNCCVGEMCNFCFNLDMVIIKVLQEKVVKVIGKVLQLDENDNEDGESGIVESIESLELSVICLEEQENEGNIVERDNSVNEEILILLRCRVYIFCGVIFKVMLVVVFCERKILQILINVGNLFKNDFKLVFFIFNIEDMKRNERVILEFVVILNVWLKVQVF